MKHIFKIFALIATCVCAFSQTATYAPLQVNRSTQILSSQTNLFNANTNLLVPPLLKWLTNAPSGIGSINGLTTSPQTFSVGTAGADFAIGSSGSTHTFNLPTATSGARGALSSTDWSTFNAKVGTTRNIIAGSGLAGGGTLAADVTFTLASTSAAIASAIADETGSGALVFGTSPTLITPSLGVATATSINGTTIPSTVTLAKTTDNLSVFAATTSAQLAGNISDETGSGALVLATSPTLVTPVLGAATATTINGTTIPASVTLLKTTDTLAVHAATTSGQLAGVLSDETGSGLAVFATSPTLTTPVLGAATATTINGTAIPSTATLTKTTDTLAVFTATTSAQLAGVLSDESGSGVFAMTVSPSFTTPSLGAATASTINGTTIPASATLVKSTDNISILAATTSSQLAGVISDETGSGLAVFATSPTLTTPVLGVATATSINGTSIPSSATLAKTADNLSVFAATTSAQLAGILSDETGTGAAVFGTSPSISAPNFNGITTYNITTVSSGASIAIDMSANQYQTITLTTDASLTTANRPTTKARAVSVFITASGAQRIVTLNASWKNYGPTSTITIPSGKEAFLTLLALDSAETDVRANFRIQP